MTNVVITGGAGFLGARLARDLLAAGSLDVAGGGERPISQVTLLDQVPAPPDLAADPRVAAAHGDLAALTAPGEAGRDGVSLDRRGLVESQGINALLESRMEVELGKAHEYRCTFRPRTTKSARAKVIPAKCFRRRGTCR